MWVCSQYTGAATPTMAHSHSIVVAVVITKGCFHIRKRHTLGNDFIAKMVCHFENFFQLTFQCENVSLFDNLLKV